MRYLQAPLELGEINAIENITCDVLHTSLAAFFPTPETQQKFITSLLVNEEPFSHVMPNRKKYLLTGLVSKIAQKITPLYASPQPSSFLAVVVEKSTEDLLHFFHSSDQSKFCEELVRENPLLHLLIALQRRIFTQPLGELPSSLPMIISYVEIVFSKAIQVCKAVFEIHSKFQV